MSSLTTGRNVRLEKDFYHPQQSNTMLIPALIGQQEQQESHSKLSRSQHPLFFFNIGIRFLKKKKKLLLYEIGYKRLLNLFHVSKKKTQKQRYH